MTENKHVMKKSHPLIFLSQLFQHWGLQELIPAVLGRKWGSTINAWHLTFTCTKTKLFQLHDKLPLVCNQNSENQYSLCDTAFSYFIISYFTSPYFSGVAACCIAGCTQGMRNRLSANPGATHYSLLASLSHGVKIWRDSSCGGNWHGTHCSRAVWLQMCWTWQTPTEIYQTGSILAALCCPVCTSSSSCVTVRSEEGGGCGEQAPDEHVGSFLCTIKTPYLKWFNHLS